MKKIMTTVLALTLALGMSVTAFATPSPVKEGAVVGAVDGQGNEVEVSSKELTTASTLEAAQAAADKVVATGKEAVPIAAFDVDCAAAAPGNPVTIYLSIPSVKLGDVIFAQHLVDGKWQTVSVLVSEDGWVNMTVNSCSPFVFFKVSTPQGNTTETNQSYNGWAGVDMAALWAAQTQAGATSPKTGEAGVVGFALIAVACGAALVFTKKKFA